MYGSFLYGAAFLLHFIVWKARVPKRQTRVLLLLFLGVLICGSFILGKYSHSISLFGLHPPASVVEYVQIWLFFISLSLAYMITYSAIAADSPTLVMIMRIAEAGAFGLSRESLEQAMNDRVLIVPRVKDLLTDRIVELDGERYLLKAKGILMARLFTFYRNVMRVGKGG